MRPTAWLISVGLLCLVLGAQIANAQSAAYRYRWVDPSGLTHYSDSLTPAATQLGYDLLNSQGMVVRHVQGELTDTQRATAKAKTAKVTAAKRAQEQKQTQDQRLLEAYPTEAAFKNVQQARIDRLDQAIHTTHANIDSQQQILSELLNHAAEITHQRKDIPKQLQDKIAAQRQTVLEQRQLLIKQLYERDQVRKDVAAKLAYYRKLQDQRHSGQSR